MLIRTDAVAAGSRLAPFAVAAGAAAACGMVLVVDPNEPGFYPTCPFLLLTGRWCPGCGSMRATRALLTGDIGAAVGLNVLLVVAVPYLIYRWVAWTAATQGRRIPPLDVPAWGIKLMLAVVVAFWVLRNIPVAPFTALAPP